MSLALVLQCAAAAAELLVPAWGLWFFLRGLAPSRTLDRFPLPWQLAAGFCVGSGLLSMLYFVWVGLLGLPPRPFAYSEWIWPLAALVLRRIKPRPPGSPEPPAADRRLPAWAVAAIAAAVLAYTMTVIAANPYYGWDAYQQIVHRALSMLYNWECLYKALVYSSHGDYPLLLPGILARSYATVGLEHWLVPAFAAAAFSVSATVCAAVGLAELRSWRHGLLAAAALAGTPLFLKTGALQYSDMPLAAYITVALTCLAACEDDAWRDDWALACFGACLGLCAWTKNEGIVVLCVFSGLFCLMLWRLRATMNWRAVRRAAAVLLPLVAVLLLFKSRTMVPNDQVNSARISEYWAMLAEPARYRQVGSFVFDFLLDGTVFGPVPLAFLLLALVSPSTERPGRAAWLGGLGGLAVLGAFLSAYLITTWSIAEHMRFSFDRLVAQLWPCFVIYGCLSRNIFPRSQPCQDSSPSR